MGSHPEPQFWATGGAEPATPDSPGARGVRLPGLGPRSWAEGSQGPWAEGMRLQARAGPSESLLSALAWKV